MATPYKLLCGLEPLRTGNYTIQLQAGCAAVSTPGTDYLIEFNDRYTIDIRIFGVGGRDYAGALVQGWHYIWLLYNSTTGESAVIASMGELGGGLNIPAGFTHIRKLNSFAFYYTPGNIQNYVFVGWPNPYIAHTLADNGSGYRALLDGTATAWTSVTFGGGLMAPSARLVRVQAVLEYISASGSGYIRTPGLGSGLLVGTVSAAATKQREFIHDLAVSSDQRLEYKVTAGVKLSLYALGHHIQETY